jgi:hypothetical protein
MIFTQWQWYYNKTQQPLMISSISLDYKLLNKLIMKELNTWSCWICRFTYIYHQLPFQIPVAPSIVSISQNTFCRYGYSFLATVTTKENTFCSCDISFLAVIIIKKNVCRRFRCLLIHLSSSLDAIYAAAANISKGKVFPSTGLGGP